MIRTGITRCFMIASRCRCPTRGSCYWTSICYYDSVTYGFARVESRAHCVDEIRGRRRRSPSRERGIHGWMQTHENPPLPRGATGQCSISDGMWCGRIKRPPIAASMPSGRAVGSPPGRRSPSFGTESHRIRSPRRNGPADSAERYSPAGLLTWPWHSPETA